ncbi:MAG: heavy metal translocating P-type ATPase [Lysobacter sp.]|nr:heavy metal translocating P-type ATPase [Lysobacter sp.]
MKTSVIEVHAMLSVLSVDEVEKRIGEVPGVESVTVNYAAGSATVRYDETRLEIADIRSAVRQRAYESAAPKSDSDAAAAAPESVAAAVPQAPTAPDAALVAAAVPAVPPAQVVAPETSPAATPKPDTEAMPAGMQMPDIPAAAASKTAAAPKPADSPAPAAATSLLRRLRARLSAAIAPEDQAPAALAKTSAPVKEQSKHVFAGHTALTPGPAEAWHMLSVEDAAERLRTNVTAGLTHAEAALRYAQQGANALAGVKQRSALSIVVHQFRSLIVVLLLAASGVALALGENIQAVAILIVIVLNAAIGFVTEWKAEAALDALRKQTVPVAHVLREGEERQIPAQELVTGDVAILSAGARVPADGRIVEYVRLQLEEAALTGESLAVTKTADPLTERDAPLGDRINMVHLGTAVTDGRGKFIVTATGMRTEMGKIGTLIEAVGARGTPLEAKLAQLGRALLLIVLVLSAVIVVTGWLRGNSFLYMLEVGISLAIAAVPEGLPAVTTMTLALGMQRMARMHALVRRLPAVETLGSTTVICTDKTGTLTRNEMTVRAFQLGERRVEVTGAGYAPAGEFRVAGQNVDASADEPLQLALRIGLLCNDAQVDRKDGDATILGDPTEAALIVAAEKGGLDRAAMEREYPRVTEVPFSSETKRMVTVHRTPAGTTVAYVKGSPGTLLEASVSQLGAAGIAPLTPADRQHWEEANRELAGTALRVLGLAYRELPEGYGGDDLGRELVFVGQVGMIDPLRDEARATMAICREAGIRAVMITGDQPATASEIARQLGIDRDAQGRALRTVHARELSGLDAAGWQAVVADAAVFARVSPEHKLQIVEALQLNGQVVAMTGDGVNDAPALKKADIGIAMGIKGTEVAKETADMVITDDNFATIVGAVEQGRIIVHNILRFIHYLFSTNFAEIVTVFAAIMIGWPLPLGALQILWINIVTDIFPAMALTLEPSAPDVMKRPPRDPNQPLMTRHFVVLIVWQGLLLAGVTLLAFYIGMRWYGTEGVDLRHAVTIAFMTLTLANVFHSFNARSRTRSAFTASLFTNGWLWAAVLFCLLLQMAAVYVPFLQTVLGTVALTTADWGVIAACSLIPVAVVELVKFVQRSMALKTARLKGGIIS